METRIEKILIAPLDWGLGHATRCIPIIQLFIEQGKEVYIASSGAALSLLKQEFPELIFFALPEYDVHYKFDSMALNMVMQLPKIRSAIMRENHELMRIVAKADIDLIISDNRYGIHHPEIPSVFIGHQLAIQMPKNMKMFSKLTLKWHKRMLAPFDQIWIPDFLDEPNLSGALSHAVSINKPLFFIGPLSRFRSEKQQEEPISLLIIISGQEPQRGDFEELIIEQITDEMGAVVLVRGLPGQKDSVKIANKNLKMYNHLSAQGLERLIAMANVVVCRSGYSSIMDMAAMKKRVLLVPTPGQTEQEYLADYLRQKKYAYSVAQDDLDLSKDLQRLSEYKPLDMINFNLEKRIKKAIKQL